MICASCARVSSSQNTTWEPAEATAQHRQAHPVAHRASFTWHARKTSPASTSCESTVSPARFTTRTVPSDGISNVLVVRSVLLGLLRHETDVRHRPIVAGSNAPMGLAVAHDRVVHTGVRRGGDHGQRCPAVRSTRSTSARSRGSSAHGRVDDDVARDVQLVMPRSESTIANAGPRLQTRGDRALDRGAFGVGTAALTRVSTAARPSLGF